MDHSRHGLVDGEVAELTGIGFISGTVLPGRAQRRISLEHLTGPFASSSRRRGRVRQKRAVIFGFHPLAIPEYQALNFLIYHELLDLDNPGPQEAIFFEDPGSVKGP